MRAMESLWPVARLARQREKKDLADKDMVHEVSETCSEGKNLADEDEDEVHGVAMACGEAG